MKKLISLSVLPALVVALLVLPAYRPAPSAGWVQKIIAVRKGDLMEQAAWAMRQKPVTITDFICERSAGGKHDFYSEGDYWWPDPKDPDGPYIRRDGETNPDNFVAHRHAMIRFSIIMGDLASAYIITRDKAYLRAALKHALAWFVDTATLMNPNLQYAQAIKGRTTGRGIGIIDTIQLLEAAQALIIMEKAGVIPPRDLAAIKNWFAEYLHWLMTSKNGQDEMNTTNNHATCWVMQAAEFARLAGDTAAMDFCRERFKNVLLPGQMAQNGSFPQETARTKPYGYSLFNLDAMSTICQILSDSKHDLWQYETPGKRNMYLGMQFMYPYVKDKSKWPFSPDVMHWKSWPVAQPFLIFGAAAYHDPAYFDLWKRLNHDPQDEEIIRNLPVRHPLIWIK